MNTSMMNLNCADVPSSPLGCTINRHLMVEGESDANQITNTNDIKFKIIKPYGWNNMVFWGKIKYFRQVIDDSYIPYVDKLYAKEIVKNTCPEIKIPKVVKILTGPYDISQTDMKKGYILKSAHASGWNIILHPGLDVDKITRILTAWYKPYNKTERQYAHIKPRFYIEKIVDDIHSNTSGWAQVIMIRCIYGKPVSIGVRRYFRNNRRLQNSYTPAFELMDRLAFNMDKPVQWNIMMEYASKLSLPFEFVRIDFYLGKKGDIYFSEYTFTPNNGEQVFTDEVERELGQLWI